MPVINVNLSIMYAPKEGVDMDTAVMLVTANLNAFLDTIGIHQGKQLPHADVPMLLPPPLATHVDIVLVKPLIVIGG